MLEEHARSESPGRIFIYSTHPVSPLKEVPSLLNQSDPTPVHELSDVELLKQMLRDTDCACIAYEVKTPECLKGLVELAYDLRSAIATGVFQFIILCQLEHPKLNSILEKLNCSKILYPPYTAKGLKLVLTRHMAMARVLFKPGDKRELRQREVREIEPLKTPDDCWLTQASLSKFIHGKWLCFAIGPGPSTGSWNEVVQDGVAKQRFKDRIWAWQPKDPANDVFIREGVWLFRGQLPEFNNTSWMFVGATPELSYYKNGELIERKFFTDMNGDLVFAQNSTAAQGKMKEIHASIDFEVHFKPVRHKSKLLEYVGKRKGGRGLSATADDIFGNGKFGKKSVDSARLALFKKAEPALRSRSKLFRLLTEDAKQSHIDDACRRSSPVVLWTSKRQIVAHSKVSSGPNEKGRLSVEYPSSHTKEQILHALFSRRENQLYFNINTMRTAIFFAQKPDEIRFNEQFIDVSLPLVVYEVQRREFLRCPIHREFTMGVMIGLDDGQQSAITGEVRDISAGGIQIEHVLGESKASQRARMIEVGSVFPNLSFELYGKTIHCSAQLRWKKETGNKRMLLGLKFIKISRADLEGIRLFVMDESYDYIESILSVESKS